MKLTLEALSVVEAIARSGSFASAAKSLHRVPSTVSYTVAKLEQDLGVRLFDRHGPRVALTHAGRALLADGRQLLKAAQDLERRVHRVASGWETEMAICVDALLPLDGLAEDLHGFYQTTCQTRLRLLQETLAGSWEALLDGRADLLVGAVAQGPAGGGYVSEPLGTVSFVFAVAPGHPLAALPGPLAPADLLAYRAISVADSARVLPVRTTGLLLGQETLTVPDMRSKLQLQCEGVGFGFLPKRYAEAAMAAGRLVEKRVVEPKPDETLCLAWRTGEKGGALQWWRERLSAPGVLERLMRCACRDWP